jgi:hypothetical protein
MSTVPQGTSPGSVIGASVALALLSTVVVAAPTEPVSAPTCVAHTVGSKLEVVCPTTTLARFLAVLQQASGLKSEYPRELGSARVSVPRQTAPLLEILESALSAFNFAAWVDQRASSSIRVRIVDMRGSGADNGAQSVDLSTVQALDPSRGEIEETTSGPAGEIQETTSGPADDGPLTSSGPAAIPQNDLWEQARERERFADSIVDALPLEPVPADPASALVPEQ